MSKNSKIIASFDNALLAEIARGRLESDGIASTLKDNHTVGMSWAYSNVLGGVKLVVQAQDADKAIEILAAPMSSDSEDSGWGACPKCNSRKLELTRRAPINLVNLIRFIFGIPLLFCGIPLRLASTYLCTSCNKATNTPNP